MRGDKPAVGDSIVIVDEYRTRRNPGANEVGTVSRVGRSLFDVDVERGNGRGTTTTFRVESWAENVDVGTGRTAYTPDEYAELDERTEMLARLVRYVRWQNLSTEQLRQVVAIMDEGGALLAQ